MRRVQPSTRRVQPSARYSPTTRQNDCVERDLGGHVGAVRAVPKRGALDGASRPGRPRQAERAGALDVAGARGRGRRSARRSRAAPRSGVRPAPRSRSAPGPDDELAAARARAASAAASIERQQPRRRLAPRPGASGSQSCSLRSSAQLDVGLAVAPSADEERVVRGRSARRRPIFVAHLDELAVVLAPGHGT